jgi:hypothetical protein
VTTPGEAPKSLSVDLVAVNGQFWVRTQIPEVGERWVRLVRAPKSDRNIVTTEKLLSQGQITQLRSVE